MDKSNSLSRLVDGYKAIALLLLNTALFFVVLNLGAGVALSVLPADESESVLDYSLESLQRVYPGRDEESIRDLLEETWSRDYVYEPYTQFREPEFEGRFINTTREGYRSNGRSLPWPPAKDVPTVFVFGGSTVFGYGLADDETIPARLQEALDRECPSPVHVYNFARSNYFSAQESILFQRLLAAEHEPHLALFVDGLNEFGHPDGKPKFTGRLEYLMAETQAQRLRRLAVNIPIARLLKRWGSNPPAGEEPLSQLEIDRVVDRWLTTIGQIRALGDRAGVRTLFSWQPLPGYGYDLEHHLFVDESTGLVEVSGAGAAKVDRLRHEVDGPLAQDFVWLGGLHEGRAEPLYVDRVHYTAAFSSEIADALVQPVAARLCAG